MSETSKTQAFIFRISSSDPFNSILYTDGGAFYSVSTESTKLPGSSGQSSHLPTPPTSPTSSRFGKGRPAQVPEKVDEVITVRSARAPEVVGVVRHCPKGGWDVAIGDEEARGTAFAKFFGLSVLGKMMGNKPRIRDPQGRFWTWHGFRSEKELQLLSPTGDVAAQFRPADSTRIADPNAALIVYACAFDIKELVVVSWLALERVQREEGVVKTSPGKGGKGKGRKGSGEWRSMSLGSGQK